MNTRRTAQTAILAIAGAVIVILTIGAFWLSYAHLHGVAADNGLAGSPARAWAWPACLDAFIIAGELLLLHNAVRKDDQDWWAITATVAGSVGSIALNVSGVQDTGVRHVLPYLVAAVPPSAALLGFGLLMRQVHRYFAHLDVQVDAVLSAQPSTVASGVSTPADRVDTRAEDLQVNPVDTEEDTPLSPPAEEDARGPARLDAEQARKVIEYGWENGLSVRETAEASTRSSTFVGEVFKKLTAERGPRPPAKPLALVRDAR